MGGRKKEPPSARTRSGTASPAASAPRPPRRPPAPCPPGRTPENTALETALHNRAHNRPVGVGRAVEQCSHVISSQLASHAHPLFYLQISGRLRPGTYGRYYSTSRRRRKYPRHADECKIFVDSQAMLHASVENPLQSRYNEKHKSCDEKETGLRCFNRRERHN